MVGRGTFEAGWRWSEHVKPLAGTDSCQVQHIGYVLEGRMRVLMNDGEGIEVAPGDVFNMPPGHDAWIVGDAACVILDFGGLRATPRRPEPARSGELWTFVEGELEEHEVDPAIELACDLGKPAHLDESEPGVEGERSSFAASTPAIMTCIPSARASRISASTSWRPMPRRRCAAATWTVCSTVVRYPGHARKSPKLPNPSTGPPSRATSTGNPRSRRSRHHRRRSSTST